MIYRSFISRRFLTSLFALACAALAGWFLLRQWGVVVPDRKMFHNVFAKGDWDLLPGWKVGRPTGDRVGNKVWIDDTLNIIVIVFLLPRVAEGDPITGISQKFGIESADFIAGGTTLLVEPADRDSIVLLSEGGSVLRITRCLGDGDARKVFSALDSCSLKSPLADCLRNCDQISGSVKSQIESWLGGIKHMGSLPLPESP